MILYPCTTENSDAISYYSVKCLKCWKYIFQQSEDLKIKNCPSVPTMGRDTKLSKHWNWIRNWGSDKLLSFWSYANNSNSLKIIVWLFIDVCTDLLVSSRCSKDSLWLPWSVSATPSEFNLTFKKWFVSYPNKNNYKMDLKCRPPWFSNQENFSV